MSMKRLPLALAALALGGATAHAATKTVLSTAPIYGGPTGASMLCIISNYNTDATVDLVSEAVPIDTGASGLTVTTNCGATLAQGASCRFTAPIPQPPPAAYACQVTISNSATVALSARLTGEVLDSHSNALFNEPGH
jgi:hypothetical protein